ncbi:MAG TPA: hypothetical protein VD707_06100 [Gemmatimonadales bacterium]|jgi:hypothetical protein|nr:hypothetical protein [Gemmatimonadales bacterium]
MRAITGLGLTIALLGLGCGSNKVLVPPALDLHPYGKLAIVTFTIENARGSLHQLATERFAEAVLAAQPGIEVLELGPQDTLLRRVGEPTLGVAAAQELGRQRRVAAVFAGHLKITNPQASGGLGGLVTPHLEATVRADLSVRLLSTESGGTVWRSSAWATRKVGGVQIVNGQLDFMARDPEKEYGPMVNTLIELVTQDLRSTWQKR